MLWLYIDKSRLQGIPQSFYSNYRPENSISLEFSISMQNRVSYNLLLFMLKIETTTRETNSIPCHSSFSDGINCGPHRGLFAIRDHLRSNLGIISGPGIICGRGSFAALYRQYKQRCVFKIFRCNLNEVSIFPQLYCTTPFRVITVPTITIDP